MTKDDFFFSLHFQMMSIYSYTRQQKNTARSEAISEMIAKLHFVKVQHSNVSLINKLSHGTYTTL